MNDRLMAPNCDAAREAFHTDFQLFARHLFHGGEYSLVYPTDRRRLFGVSLKSAERFSVKNLLEKVS